MSNATNIPSLMSEHDLLELTKAFAEILQSIELTQAAKAPLEYKLYYDVSGKVITYTTDELPGDYIVITKQQYAEARSDVIVKNGVLTYTHLQSHVFKLEKNKDGMLCSKYDVSIIVNTDGQYWKQTQHEITRGNN